MDALTTTTAIRRFPRRAVSEAVHLAPADGQKRLAVLLDVSCTGALVLSSTRFEAGDAIDLTVYPDAQARGAVVVRGRVVWATARSGAVLWAFALGIEFEDLLCSTLVAALTSRDGLLSCEAAFPVEVKATPSAPSAALAHDLTASGALLLCRGRFNPGERLRLTLHCADGAFPGAGALRAQPVDCTVVRVERCDDEDSLWRFAVGVRFDHALGCQPIRRRAA